MNLLSKMNNLGKTTNTTTRVEMTPVEMAQCKEAIRAANRGYNVHPNQWDRSKPYRVSINFNGEPRFSAPKSKNDWFNFGEFTSADVAAAVGTIVSMAFFGDNAKVGEFDATVVEGHEEYNSWLAKSINASTIAAANGDVSAVVMNEEIGAELTAEQLEANPF